MKGKRIMDKKPTDFDGKLVYIASPYAGDVEYNIKFARAACRYCIEKGNVPIAVHLLYPPILDDADPEQRQTGLKLGRCILEKCDELWICGSHISPGMIAEIVEAERLGILIRIVSINNIHIDFNALPDKINELIRQSHCRQEQSGMKME